MIHLTQPGAFNSKFEVVCCYVEHGGKILLLHRTNHKPEGGTWCTPGGKIEENESPFQAMMRELREETGFEPEERNLIHFGMFYVRYPTCDFKYHIFHATPYTKPEIKINPSEHQDFIWVTPLEALKMNLILDEDESIKLFYKIS